MKNITPINRRQFIQQTIGGLTALTASFFILPSSLTYQRIWRWILSRPVEEVAGNPNCAQFAAFLDSQSPFYDRMILKDIQPSDGWIGLIEPASFPAAVFIDTPPPRVLQIFNHGN